MLSAWDGAWSLETIRKSDGASRASAIFDSAVPPEDERDLGTPGECGGGPGVGWGGRNGTPGANCNSLGNLVVAHGGNLAAMRRCNCSSFMCVNCQPNDDPAGASFKFYFRSSVFFDHVVAVDLEGYEALTIKLPNGVTRVVSGLGPNAVQLIPIGAFLVPGQTISLVCSGSCGFAMFSMNVCDPLPTKHAALPTPPPLVSSNAMTVSPYMSSSSAPDAMTASLFASMEPSPYLLASPLTEPSVAYSPDTDIYASASPYLYSYPSTMPESSSPVAFTDSFYTTPIASESPEEVQSSTSATVAPEMTTSPEVTPDMAVSTTTAAVTPDADVPTPSVMESMEVIFSTPGATTTPELSTSTPVAEETAEVAVSTISATITPEVFDSTPAATESLEIVAYTPIATETPGVFFSTPSVTITPEVVASTLAAAESPDVITSTPIAVETPEVLASTPSVSMIFEVVASTSASESLEVVAFTPIATETPEVVFSTPSVTMTPEVAASTPAVSESPEVVAPTPIATETPELVFSTPHVTVTPEFFESTLDAAVTIELMESTPIAMETPETVVSMTSATMTPEVIVSTPMAVVTAEMIESSTGASASPEMIESTPMATETPEMALSTISASTTPEMVASTPSAEMTSDAYVSPTNAAVTPDMFVSPSNAAATPDMVMSTPIATSTPDMFAPTPSTVVTPEMSLSATSVAMTPEVLISTPFATLDVNVPAATPDTEVSTTIASETPEANVSTTPSFSEPTPAPLSSEPPITAYGDDSCEMEDAIIDFNDLSVGLPVRYGDGFWLATRRLGPFSLDDASAIFDSQYPSTNDSDLGSPNANCNTGGPGMGYGGTPGARGENCEPLGKLLIAHEGDMNLLRTTCSQCSFCKECAPDDGGHGAQFVFTFTTPTVLQTVVLLDVDELPRSLSIRDHRGQLYEYAGYGDNGKLVIDLNYKYVPVNGTLTIHCAGSCGIAEIVRKRCRSSPPVLLPPQTDTPLGCAVRYVNFDWFATGRRVDRGEHWVLRTARMDGPVRTYDVSAAFNTSMPTGGDTDLGAPNSQCGGPGVGFGGVPGAPGENCEQLGQVLIAHSGDIDALRNACWHCDDGQYCPGCEPNDHAGGAHFAFTFVREVRVLRVVLMDLDDAPDSARVVTPGGAIDVRGMGDNSVQTVELGAVVFQMADTLSVYCVSSCAVVRFEYLPCI